MRNILVISKILDLSDYIIGEQNGEERKGDSTIDQTQCREFWLG